MESATTLAANEKQCPQCGRPMPAWCDQCEACSAELAQRALVRPPKVHRPGFVTFFVVLTCLGAVAQIAIGLIEVAYPLIEDLTVAGMFFWLMIAPGLAALGICMTGLWYMRLWSWILTVVHLSVVLLLIVGFVLFALMAMAIGGISEAASAVMQGLVIFVIVGGSLLWFLTHRRDFVTERDPINKTRLFLSSLFASGLTLLLSAGSIAVLWFLLTQQQSDLHVSVATSLLLPIIPVIWMVNGAMISVWLYQRLAAVASVPAEHGAIVGITTGVVSALCLVLLVVAVGFVVQVSSFPSPPAFNLAMMSEDYLIALITLAAVLLLVLPGSLFGWLGGELGVRTQKNRHTEALMAP